MYFFTSESVSEGHPDKVADAISDAILDLALSVKTTEAKQATRVACETMVTTNRVIVAGEYKGVLNDTDVEATIKQVVKDIGYEQDGFNWKTLKISNYLHGQSADIALGTDNLGAGDQGIMFGFANDDTEEYMPAAIYYSHKIVKRLAEIRKAGESMLGPDAKSQVTIEYTVDNRVDNIPKIVCSTQHSSDSEIKQVKELVLNTIHEVIPSHLLTNNTEYLINPTGRFVIGGPDGDCGLTGRKIIVDTYGGYSPHGGGAFSGKDPSKVDRSAAYMSRYLAKNIVSHYGGRSATVQLSYAIGVKEPTSIFVMLDGKVREDIASRIKCLVDLTPKGIIDRFDLFRPIYRKTTNYGHFGKSDNDLAWENINLF
jgi:S-adenosylmethionine synthetase